jgi:hypothetical protein
MSPTSGAEPAVVGALSERSHDGSLGYENFLMGRTSIEP